MGIGLILEVWSQVDMSDQYLFPPNPPLETYHYYSTPSVFIDPLYPERVYLSAIYFTGTTDIGDGMYRSVSGHFSFDGGQSWIGKPPYQLGFSGHGPAVAKLKFKSKSQQTEGPLLILYVDSMKNPVTLTYKFVGGVSYSYTLDYGQNWTTDILDPNPGFSDWSPHLWVDNSLGWMRVVQGNQVNCATNPCRMQVYSGWTRFEGQTDTYEPHELRITGAQFDPQNNTFSWAQPKFIGYSSSYIPQREQGINIQTGPMGDVYIAWAFFPNKFYNSNNLCGSEPGPTTVYNSEPRCSCHDNCSKTGTFQVGGTAVPTGLLPCSESGIYFTHCSCSEDSPGSGGPPILNCEEPSLVQSLPGAPHGLSGYPSTVFFGIGTNILFNLHSFPTMAVNQQNGHIFMAFAYYNNPPNLDAYAGIAIRKSEDQGVTWQGIPFLPNLRSDGTLFSRFHPWLVCDEASGTLVLTYYSNKEHPDSLHTYIAISYDEGNTWQEYKVSDHARYINPNGKTPPFPHHRFLCDYGGDKLGLDVYYWKGIAAWSQTIPVKKVPEGAMTVVTQPFEVPCPENLELIYGNYVVGDQGVTFGPDAEYKARKRIEVAGNNNMFTVCSSGYVRMRAGEEIVLSDGFESYGEFEAYIDPSLCGSGGGSSVAGGRVVEAPSVSTEATEGVVFPKPLYQVYPNPVTEGLYVVSFVGEREPVRYEVYNLQMAKMKEGVFQSGQGVIDMRDLSAGMYILKLCTEGHGEWFDIVVKD